MQQTILVPDWIFQGLQFLGRNWLSIICVIAVALIASGVSEVIKRKYLLKKIDPIAEEARLKKAVAWLLTIVATGFTTLGYVIVFLQSNQSVLSQVPQIGQASLEVIGVAYSLYNLRLNKTWQNLAAKLGSWSKSGTTPTTTFSANGETSSAQATPQPADVLE